MKITQRQVFDSLASQSKQGHHLQRSVELVRPRSFGCALPEKLLAQSSHRKAFDIRHICTAAATLEYGSLGDLGVSASTYVVLVGYRLPASPKPACKFHLKECCSCSAELFFLHYLQVPFADRVHSWQGLAHCFEKNEEGKLTNR